MPVLCVDCLYLATMSQCEHPNLRSLVTGNITHAPAERIRRTPEQCGHEGKWFHSKAQAQSAAAPIPEPPPRT